MVNATSTNSILQEKISRIGSTPSKPSRKAFELHRIPTRAKRRPLANVGSNSICSNSRPSNTRIVFDSPFLRDSKSIQRRDLCRRKDHLSSWSLSESFVLSTSDDEIGRNAF